MSNLDAAQSNDVRKALIVLRDSLAKAIDDCPPTMTAQIAGQYRATLADLESLPNSLGMVKKRDELANRRKDRGSVPEAVAVPRKSAGKRGG